MPFYRILGDWDEMGPVGDAEVDGAETVKANQQVRQKYNQQALRDPLSSRPPACLPCSRILALDDRYPVCLSVLDVLLYFIPCPDDKLLYREL